MNAIEKYKQVKVSAVVRTDDKEQSLKIAKALILGGINLIEITVENPEMYDVIRVLCNTTDASIVAGGVITARQAHEAINAGACAIVSPIFQPGLVKLCQAKDVPVVTTATTPNEAYQAWKAGVHLIKISPSHQMGGASYIRDLLRPMPFLNIIATGSIKLDEVKDYLDAGADAVTIGRDFWFNVPFDTITSRAKTIVAKVEAYTNNNKS